MSADVVKEINDELVQALENDTRLRALHRQGLTDGKIAESLGVSAMSVSLWRRRLGLDSTRIRNWRCDGPRAGNYRLLGWPKLRCSQALALAALERLGQATVYDVVRECERLCKEFDLWPMCNRTVETARGILRELEHNAYVIVRRRGIGKAKRIIYRIRSGVKDMPTRKRKAIAKTMRRRRMELEALTALNRVFVKEVRRAVSR